MLLKATYDPRWTVTVDKVRATPEMMAPSLVGVEVPPGTHVVEFRYAPYGGYPVLLSVGALGVLALVFLPRRFVSARIRERAGRRRSRERAAADARGSSRAR